MDLEKYLFAGDVSFVLEFYCYGWLVIVLKILVRVFLVFLDTSIESSLVMLNAVAINQREYI